MSRLLVPLPPSQPTPQAAAQEGDGKVKPLDMYGIDDAGAYHPPSREAYVKHIAPLLDRLEALESAALLAVDLIREAAPLAWASTVGVEAMDSAGAWEKRSDDVLAALDAALVKDGHG